MKMKLNVILNVPKNFEGNKYWGRIQCLESIINDWFTSDLEDRPDVSVEDYSIESFPESWWKELIPEDEWEEEKLKLIKSNSIMSDLDPCNSCPNGYVFGKDWEEEEECSSCDCINECDEKGPIN